MVITEIREELIAVRQEIEAGNTSKALEQIDHAIEGLSIELLTTTQAKDVLGLGSVNTVKLLVKNSGLPYEVHGNRMMVPLSTLEQLRESQIVRGLRASDRLHAQSADLGAPDGLTQLQLDDLEASRPGTLPWSTSPSAASTRL